MNIEKMKQLFPIWVTLGIACIILLGHFGWFPLPAWIVGVIFLVLIGLTIWKPVKIFGIFLSTITLEYIPLGVFGGADLRWYQITGVALFFGLIVRYFLGKEDLKKYGNTLGWIDGVVGTIGFASVISAMLGGGAAPKQTMVFFSFIFLYFLTRYFIRNRRDIVQTFPFFIGSFFIVALYAIAQNVLFSLGLPSGETMPGRPNGTFPEADWLGLYAGIGVIFSSLCLLAVQRLYRMNSKKQWAFRAFSYELGVLAWILLIITVARSAWISTVIGLSLMMMVLWRVSNLGWVIQWGKQVFITAVVGLVLVLSLGLTSFELGNRVQSTGSGLQEITIVCEGGEDAIVPQVIENVGELEQYGCQQINLEEINDFSSRGFAVGKVFRKDPTVEIRKRIWGSAWEMIRKHPIMGIGWGNSGETFGTDANGASLNSSNLFLEFWLGSGMIGFVGMVYIFGYIFARSIRLLMRSKINSNHNLFLFGILGITTMIFVFSLFNAGQFLAIFWVFLAIALTRDQRDPQLLK